MTASMHQKVYPVLAKKMISLWSRLIACCKLALTLARQMWRHNYVIDRHEYLIFTLSKSINPWLYSLQFLFKTTNNSWRYERKCDWVFFSEHSVLWLNGASQSKSYYWQPIGSRIWVSQRPTYVEVGPLMTTRFGEVRWSTAVRQELMV